MGLAKNSVLYLISTICLKAVGFLLLPIYTHLVSPEEYGYVYVVSAFQTFMGLFLTLSMHGAISRFYFDCKNLEEIRSMYSQQVTSISISSTVLVAIMLVLTSPLSSLLALPVKYYVYAVLISYFSIFYNMIIALLYAMEQALKISVTSICVGVVTIVVQLTLVLTMEDKALGLISAMLINAVLTFVIFLIYSYPYFIIPKFKKYDMVKYFKYSISQLPSDVSVWFVSASDRILLNRMQGAYSTGVYGMGNTLGHVPSMLFQSVNKAYVPYVFRHYKEAEDGSQASMKELAETTTKVESVITCLVVCLIIISNNIVELLEARYIDSAIIMPLILFAIWIDCNRIIFMNPLAYNVKYIKVKSFIWVFAAILDVGMNFYLIPRYSMWGACASLIISYGVSCLLILYFSNKAMKIIYDKQRIAQVLLISALFSTTYFLGSGLVSFLWKLPLIAIYLYIVLRINNMQGIILNYLHKHV